VRVRRLGVIGDLHGEHERLERVLEWFAGQRVDAVICTGDVADGRGSVDISCRLLREAEVITVAGNHDRWLLADRVRHVPNAHRRENLAPETRAYLEALPRTALLDTVAGPAMLCHGVGENDLAKVWPGTPRSPIERNEALDELIAAQGLRFMINGHLHYRVLIDFPDFLLVNAGTVKGDLWGVSIMDFADGHISAFQCAGGTALSRVAERTLHPAAGRRVWASTRAFDGTWEPCTLYG